MSISRISLGAVVVALSTLGACGGSGSDPRPDPDANFIESVKDGDRYAASVLADQAPSDSELLRVGHKFCDRLKIEAADKTTGRILGNPNNLAMASKDDPDWQTISLVWQDAAEYLCPDRG